MDKDAICRLYAYNRWATGQILTAAENLTPEQFLAPDDTPYGSIRKQLFHILEVQQGWRGVWERVLYGSSGEDDAMNEDEFPDLDSIVALWWDVEAKTEAFNDSVTEEQLSRVITVKFDWDDVSAPLWEMMVHVVNHGTQHRSEVAMKLTNFGYSPGMLDVLFFSVANSDQARA